MHRVVGYNEEPDVEPRQQSDQERRHDREPPFLIEHGWRDMRRDGDFVPSARLVVTSALRTSGLLAALPGEEAKSLLLLVTFLTPNGLIRPKFMTNRYAFHDTELSSHVRAAYHALAIDERRKPFEPTLWKRQDHATEQTLEQVWFSGVHCDVGGGYSDPSLGEIPLLWMADRAREHGLALDPDRLVPADGHIPAELRAVGIRVAPDSCGEIHDSFKGAYKVLGPYERPLDADDGAVAGSALRRRETRSDYAPRQLDGYRGPTATVPDASARATA